MGFHMIGVAAKEETMSSIPRAALLLGLAGVLPFAWGVLTLYKEALGMN